MTLRLPCKPPYEWPTMIGFLAARAIPGVEHVKPGCYARTILLGEAHGTIEVRPADPDAAVLATIRFPAVTALPAIVERIRRMFDLGADPLASSPLPNCSLPRRDWTTRSGASRNCRASASGRRSRSPCGRCANPTRFPSPMPGLLRAMQTAPGRPSPAELLARLAP